MSITRFFEAIGMPLHNDRWSWGAQNGDVIVLRSWADQCNVPQRRVAVLHQKTLIESVSAGLDERVQHLKSMWKGQSSAYTVIATAVDPAADNRSIASFREDLFAIDSLSVDDRGTFWANYSRIVRPGEFAADAVTHRTAGSNDPFPIDVQEESGLSSATVREKLPHMRQWLIGVARNRTPVQYAELMRRFDLWYGTLFTSLKLLGQACVAAREPVITALVVDKDTGRCSKGFKEVFRIEDDEAERERCYAYWMHSPDLTGEANEELISEAKPVDESEIEARIARFMSVEVRQDQPAFRRALFVAYGGRCAISGCDVPEALEAAHLRGRDWRLGHNQAADGILLRRDLHSLYDRELLDFSNGKALFSSRVVHHYPDLDGVVVARPCNA